MKLLPIFKHIIAENYLLSNGNYWVGENGHYYRFSCTHGQFVYKNINMFDPPEDAIEYGAEPGEDESFLYNLAFDKGWVRLVVNNSSFGKAANVEFSPKKVDRKAIGDTLEDILVSDVKTLYIDQVDGVAGTFMRGGGDAYHLKEDDEMEDFLKKYGRYM